MTRKLKKNKGGTSTLKNYKILVTIYPEEKIGKYNEIIHVYDTINDSYIDIIKKLEHNLNLTLKLNKEDSNSNLELKIRGNPVNKSCFDYLEDMMENLNKRIKLLGKTKEIKAKIIDIEKDYEILIDEVIIKGSDQEMIFQTIIGCIQTLYEVMVDILILTYPIHYPIYNQYLELKIDRIKNQLATVKGIEHLEHKQVETIKINPLKIGNNKVLYELWKIKKKSEDISPDEIESIKKCQKWRYKLSIENSILKTELEEEKCTKVPTKVKPKLIT